MVVAGSSQTIIHPILSRKERLKNHHYDRRCNSDDDDDGGGGGGASASSSSLFMTGSTRVPENYYCAENPCINARIHQLHMDMLAGVQDAEMEMNRYLLLCATLLRRQHGHDGDSGNKNSTALSSSCVKAHIAWKCDICNGSNTACCKGMVKGGYAIQFRDWKVPGFCCFSYPQGQDAEDKTSLNKRSKKNNHRAAAATTTTTRLGRLNNKSARCLELPIVQCLKTSLEDTPCYHSLPDLGMYIRGILQRRYYTEPIRKHWVKACCTSSSSSPQPMQQQQHNTHPNSSNHHHHHHAEQQMHALQQQLEARTKAQWRYMHGTCANLLLESIPCMKKAKRSSSLSTSTSSQNSSQTMTMTMANSCDPVETMACINVMMGTLLKLYPLGAKTPTFNARVHLMSRMMLLTNGMSTAEQQQFVLSYPSLMRICFMEYSINAMMDWLPCERALLLLMGVFSSTPLSAEGGNNNQQQQQQKRLQQQAMQTYSNIAVAMCDIFRQDAIITGQASTVFCHLLIDVADSFASRNRGGRSTAWLPSASRGAYGSASSSCSRHLNPSFVGLTLPPSCLTNPVSWRPMHFCSRKWAWTWPCSSLEVIAREQQGAC